jgi:hypothetical protein
MTDYLKDFAMSIPTDVYRHPDGTPVVGMTIEEKERFVKYCEENGITDENTTWKERDELFLQWKNTVK